MKTARSRIVFAIIWIIALAVVAVLVNFYTSTVSDRLYDEAKRNFSEVYEQVDRNFIAFMDDTWKNLTDWGPYLNELDTQAATDYIHDRQEVWGFSRFLYLNEAGQAITITGESVNLGFNVEQTGLFEDSGRIMAEIGLESSSPETIFATSSEQGVFRDFPYDAIAVTYNNADLANTIKTEAFSGQSMGFVVYPDGTIALSTQQGGNVFSNYLTYLDAGSDLTDEQIADLQAAWEAGEKNVIVCTLGDTDYYISYRPLGYEDYVLLGVVPTDAVSGSLRNVQKMTVDFLVKVFLILAVIALIQLYVMHRQRMKKTKAEIEYRDVLFDLLSANLDDIFMVIDAQTLSVSYITPNVERLLGVAPDEVKKDLQSLRDRLADKDKAVDFDLLRSIKLGNRYEHVQEWFNQDDGSHRWFKEAIYRMNIQDEEMYIFILSDRTEDRIMAQSLEEALEAAKNANLAKSQFLSNMSHDIRTPMNAIMGFTTLLDVNANDPERVREYVRKISSSSRHLLSLINDVLDMSKIESGKTELSLVEFSLAELIEEVNAIMAPQASAKDQLFEVRMEGHPNEFLMGDKLRINQILINLLSNAVKYTQVGGHIEFIIKELPSINPNFNNVRFIVKDDGMGMSEEYLKVIFDPFTRETNSITNKIQGTGLGMAITKNIVDLMGGTIAVESRLGSGSTFEVDLTFEVSESSNKERYWKSRPGFRVFAVDDDEYVCEAVKTSLEEEGVIVDFATNGETALTAIADAHAAGNDPDVILVDWQMPEQSGIEVTREIRKIIGPDVPIFVLTAYDWGVIEQAALGAGVNGFLSKPFFVTSLSQKLTMREHGTEEVGKVEASADALQGLHILAAEDNDLSAEMLIERLDMEGAQVQRARDGSEAVAMFEASEPGEYDLILMDVQMPIMGGHEATRTIRKSEHPDGKTIPIFAMTANVFADDVRDALDAGMDAHIPKPIDMDELRRVTERALNRKDHQDEN